jgi:hypothetical protein
MMAILIVLLLGTIVGAMVWGGISRESQHPTFPRERRTYMIEKLGEEYRWWRPQDMFGMRPSPDWLPPSHEETAIVRLSELLAHEQRTEVRVRTFTGEQTEERIGG